MVLRSAAALTAALAVPGLVMLSGCGAEEPAAPLLTSGCMVSSPAGFADRSIGQMSFGEVSNAQRSEFLGSTSTQRVDTLDDTRRALESYADRGCTLTALLGPGGAGILAEVAQDHPEQAWMAVGTGGTGAGGQGFPDNVITIDFDLLEPAFIAGYIAAASSKTGVVAAYSSYGFENNRGLLTAFDAGVELYNEDSGAGEGSSSGEGGGAEDGSEDAAPVRSHRGGQIEARTVSDTAASGLAITREAIEADADVIVPFASGAASGSLAWFQEHYFPPEPADAAAEGEAAPSDEPTEVLADEPKRTLVWYGADGSETLGRVGRYVIASIVPNIAAGFQTTIEGWPRTGFAGEIEPPGEDPEEIGELLVRSRSYRGTVENGGISMVASDVPLSGVAGVGREISEVQERIRSGDVDLP